MLLIGLDMGGSTTKAVLVEGSEIKHKAKVVASEPIVSGAGAIGKLLEEVNLATSEVNFAACTGGGSREVGGHLLEIKTEKVDEIRAIGLGGLFLSGQPEAAVSSIGTGTAVVGIRRGEGGEYIIGHLGGTGVGGGTLLGLSRLLLNKNSVDSVIEMSSHGELDRVDLTIKDIIGGPVGRLPESATASNFGKVGDETRIEDVAAGLLNVVAQVSATVTYLAAKSEGLEDKIVLVGMLPTIPRFARGFKETVSLFGGKAEVPPDAEFAAAFGATLEVTRGLKITR